MHLNGGKAGGGDDDDGGEAMKTLKDTGERLQ